MENQNDCIKVVITLTKINNRTIHLAQLSRGEWPSASRHSDYNRKLPVQTTL